MHYLNFKIGVKICVYIYKCALNSKCKNGDQQNVNITQVKPRCRKYPGSMWCFHYNKKLQATCHINFLHILQYFFMKYFLFEVQFELIRKSWSKYTLCCTVCVLLHCVIPSRSHLCVHYSKRRNFNKDLILAFYASFLGMLKLNSIHNIFTPHVFSANSTLKQCVISTRMNIS